MIRLEYWRISGLAVAAAAVLCLGADVVAQGSGGAVQSVKLKDLDGKIEVSLGGGKFTEYRYKGLSRPILYPIIGPGGVAMTRNYPIVKGVKGEAGDHPHHTSLWYSHGSVNGHDFWAVGEGKGGIVQFGSVEGASDKTREVIRTRNKWVSADGRIQCTDERTIAFPAVKGGRAIDYQITIKASNGDVTFGDTKEGAMAIRTNPVLRLDNDPKRGVTGARGKCVNSEGVEGKAVWGKRAKWVDYWAPVGGKTVGVAIFDHPSNPRHPTWWHARAYGLVAANPFGVHDFERKPAGAGDMKIKAGGSVTFRYRFIFHEGDAKEAKIAELYKAFAESKAVGESPPESVSPSEPFTRIYDVPAEKVAALSEKALLERSGWLALKENDTTHRFKGCTVFMNDKIVAVLGKDTPGVEMYSRQGRGVKLCGRLQPVGSDGAGLKRTSLTVRKNTADSVSLDVALQSPGGKACGVTYTLDVGGAFIKTSATAGAARLRVRAPCRFAVMPDFFGDDIVVDAAGLSVDRADLPSENFLMHMMHGGDAILMTVSESRDNDIEITLSKSAPRRIESSEISYGKKRNIWVAILAGKGIWHERTVSPKDVGEVLKLDWRMPFDALWRVDWGATDKITDSWQMLLQAPGGKYVMQGWFGQDPSSGQRFGPEFGPRDWNKPGRKRWNPVLGAFLYPCWIDKDRRGYLQPLKNRRYVERGEVYNFAGPAIIYPLDRVKAAPFRTPIEKLTIVDLVRMTLGVGPCKYILDLEGQKRNSKGVATCYARDIITSIYSQGTQLKNGPVIEKKLVEAVAFIRNVRERIDEYMAFGRETRTYLQEQKRLHPKHAEFLDELLSITRRLDQFHQSRKASIRTPQYAAQAAADFRRDLLKYTGPDASGKCAAQMKIFTGIGGSQDGLVASLRMIVKILRQRSGLAMTGNPELKDIATEIRLRTRKVLRNPTAYEAPEH